MHLDFRPGVVEDKVAHLGHDNGAVQENPFWFHAEKDCGPQGNSALNDPGLHRPFITECPLERCAHNAK